MQMILKVCVHSAGSLIWPVSLHCFKSFYGRDFFSKVGMLKLCSSFLCGLIQKSVAKELSSVTCLSIKLAV
jgi:hypothetical protein